LPDIDDVIGDQKVLKTIRFGWDKDGKLVQLDSGLLNPDNAVQGNGSVDPLGANDAEIIQITIAAGEILEIWSLDFASGTGAKPVGIGTSTDAVFADPFSGMTAAALLWATLIPTTLSMSKEGQKAPLITVDNRAGSATLYCYIFAYDAYLGVVQVNAQEVGGSYSGYQY